MLEALSGAVITIVLGVIANLLTTVFQASPKVKPVTVPNASDLEIRRPDPPHLTEWRANNREKLETVISKIFYYSLSYVAMYLAFFLPVIIIGGFVNPAVNLSGSKLGINYAINEENLSAICAIFGVLAFAPFWKLSQHIANLISSIATRFMHVSEIQILAFTLLAMVFWSFFVAGNISWLLVANAGWLDSIKFSLALWLVLILLALVSSR